MTPRFVTDELDLMEFSDFSGLSRSLTAQIQKEIKATLSYAVHIGCLKVNPLQDLRKRKVPKKRKVCLTHEEANKLLYEAKRQDHPYYLVWLLSLFLGCRRSELAGLKWTDFDFNTGLVQIVRQKMPGGEIVDHPKDKEERVTPIHHAVVPTLLEYKLKSRSEWVIELDDSDWNWGNQASVIKQFCSEIGIKEITHHQLRNTFITLALGDKCSLAAVKDSVGHEKLSTTDEYYSSAGLHLRGSMDGLSIKVPPVKPGELVSIDGGVRSSELDQAVASR